MTVIAVLAEPPREGLVLSDLVASSPLTEAEAADLYTAMLKDIFVAVSRSGGDLLVNYRADEDLPAEHRTDTPSEAALRSVAADALDDLGDVRFEVQVGSSFDACAGNTATHLLREEGVNSAAVVRPTAAFLTRAIVDAAAMKLRSTPVVLGPASDGRTYYAAFAAPIDFADAFEAPSLSTLTDRALDADLDVDFVEMRPVVERGTDLTTVVATLQTRQAAGRLVPRHTAAFFESSGLTVTVEGDTPRVVRDETDSS